MIFGTRKNILPYIALLMLLPAACSKQESELPPRKAVEKESGVGSCDDESTRTQVLIVELRDEVTAPLGLTKAMTPIGGFRMERLFPDAGEFEERHREFGLHKWFRIEFDGAGSAEAMKILEKAEGVCAVERERPMRSSSYFNDPHYARQWDLQESMNLERVWHNFTCGSPEVIVCVQDEGVDMSHEDLIGVCIPPGENGSKCFINNDTGYNIVAGNHGTHVAGTVAAINGNAKGVCGIAGGRDGAGGVKIMSCEVLRENPEDHEKPLQGNQYNAMVWAADHGAVISQNSWEYVYDSEEDAKKGGVGSIKKAIDYFIEYAGVGPDGEQKGPMRGGVVFFSAGNENWECGWPAAYEGNGKCIAVGATSSVNTKAVYSNFGPWVDICAPGGDNTQGQMIYNCFKGSKYGLMQGTSMACPHASGVAALLVSYFGGPGFTNDMLVERLLGGADRKALPPSSKIGPLLDAYGAFTYGDATPPEGIGDHSWEVKADKLTWTLDVPSDGDKPAYGISMVYGESADALTKVQDFVLAPDISSGDRVSFSFNFGAFGRKYYAALCAYDYQGNRSGLTDVCEIVTTANSAPTISTDYAGDFRIKAHDELVVEFDISDPDGHEVSVDFEPGSGAAEIEDHREGRYAVTVTGKKAPAGTYRAGLKATDSYGAETEFSFEYTILPNHAPTVVRQIDNIYFVDLGGKTVIPGISGFFADEDAENLRITYSLSDKRIASLFINGDNMIVSPLVFGMSEAKVSATDACGASASINFKVLVKDSRFTFDIFPNPATDHICIRPEKEGKYRILLTGLTGMEILATETFISPFEPLRIPLDGVSGGIYQVKISGDGADWTYSFAKK